MGGFIACFEVRAVAPPLYQMLPKAARSFSKVRAGEQIITCSGKMPGQAFSLLDYNLEATIFWDRTPQKLVSCGSEAHCGPLCKWTAAPCRDFFVPGALKTKSALRSMLCETVATTLPQLVQTLWEGGV